VNRSSNGRDRRDQDWIQPQTEQQGLGRYVGIVRERIWLIVLITILTTAVAMLYVATATKEYEAEATMLIQPVSSSEVSPEGLGLIRESSDPTRDVETASQLIVTQDVAERVREELGLSESAESLLDRVEAEPVAQSLIVLVTARDTSPEAAAELATTFAQQAVAERTDQLHEQIDQILPALEASQEADSSDVTSGQIAFLTQLREGPDPTLKVETEASVPSSPVSPRPVLSAAAGIFAGIALGLAAAFASQVLDPRLRREEQLRQLYRLPVLARIPKETGSSASSGPLDPMNASPVVAEAYRTLRGTISAGKRGARGTTLLVTGSSPSEGKTTTAINLAASLAAAGNRVILIEADLRRPAISPALGIKAHRGVVSVLIESVSVEDALINHRPLGANLELLLADYEGGWISELFALPAAIDMLEEARQLADYVIVDSPPLTDVVDALPLARQVDEVLIVARPGTTKIQKLSRLGELLAENGIRPLGFVVVGTKRPGRSESTYYADAGDRSNVPEPVTGSPTPVGAPGASGGAAGPPPDSSS
jgi:capsular exopolysaccharide synthesis family protein